nr:flagellar biosynthetic protein FliO [Thermomonas alba]
MPPARPAQAHPAQTHALVMPPAHAPAAPSAAGTIGGTLFALALVLALIFTLAWLARRIPGFSAARQGGLRVVTSLALGARERLLVVEVGSTQLLLASGPSGTRLLHTLEQPLPAPPPATTPAAPFARVLAQHFGKIS